MSIVYFTGTDKLNGRKIRHVMNQARSGIECGDGTHFRFGKREIENVEVSGHPFLADSLWNHNHVALVKPSQNDLLDGDYVADRSLEYYAGRLCITPHYLSEISKNLSGQPATYWIDRFVSGELSRLLLQPGLSLEAIADCMNFSSVSYLSCYVKNKLSLTPTEYRNNFFNQGDGSLG